VRACVHVAGTSARSSSGGVVVVYEYRMFMFLAAARQSLANIGSQFNDQPPIARNFPAVGSSRAASSCQRRSIRPARGTEDLPDRYSKFPRDLVAMPRESIFANRAPDITLMQ